MDSDPSAANVNSKNAPDVRTAPLLRAHVLPDSWNARFTTLPTPRTRRCTIPQYGTLKRNAPEVPIAPGPSLTIGPVGVGAAVAFGGGCTVTFAGTRPWRDASSSDRIR